MPTIIPFTGQLDDEERDKWIAAINQHSKRFRISALEQLSESEKQACECVIVADPDPAKLTTLPGLIWIQSLWAGVENMLQFTLDSNPQIVRLTDPNLAKAMAEAVLAWSLYLHRDMPHYRQAQNNTQWNPLPLKPPEHCNISVFGLGKLGTQAAIKLQQNDFTVRGWSNSKKHIEGVETFNGKEGLQAILPKTDIAAILLPLTADTENLFSQSRLDQLPKGASIINFARGPILNENDVLVCLDSGQLGHAVLDVFNLEPLPEDHAFWSHDQVTVLPHISGPTPFASAAELVANNIDNYIESGTIPEAVDRSRGY